MLKKYFWWIILLITIAYWGYFQLTHVWPCQQPIKYTVGSFDGRFNLSKADFIRAIEDGGHIWENNIGKNLFEYDSSAKKGDLVVNLIYDYRQKAVDENKVLTSRIDASKDSVDTIKLQITGLQNEYDQASKEYLSLVSQYKKRQIDFNTVEAKRLEVNRLADEVNAMIKKYNLQVKSINSTIQTVNQSAGKEFEEGLYSSDSKGEKIDIYEFSDRDVLVRVLAHELGHALGLGHNENPESIMFYLNDSKNIKPTKDDLGELKTICKMK